MYATESSQPLTVVTRIWASTFVDIIWLDTGASYYVCKLVAVQPSGHMPAMGLANNDCGLDGCKGSKVLQLLLHPGGRLPPKAQVLYILAVDVWYRVDV